MAPLRIRSRFAKATRFTGKQAMAAAAGTGKPLPHMADILPADMEREHVIHSADERWETLTRVLVRRKNPVLNAH